MKYFINSILGLIFKSYNSFSIEQILKKSAQLVDIQTLIEIKEKCGSFISTDGAFCDRAGKSDIYYTLFGMFVSEAIVLEMDKPKLKNYIEKLNHSNAYKGVSLYSAAIVNYKLFGQNQFSKNQINHIKNTLAQPAIKADYNLFLGVLSLYIHKEYLFIYKLLKKINDIENDIELPCPVLAAMAIIRLVSGKNIKKTEQKLMGFYRGDGSFGALKNAPTGDLLSTSVALYALNFIKADLRMIKPECLQYVDSLYHEGSFTATAFDFDTDIEYTFYGLLALGSLV